MTIEMVFDLFQMLTAIALTALTWREIIKQKKEGASVVTLAFFAFSLVAVVMSDLYWIVFHVLRPESRMPMSASEIGECGFMLLLSASLSSLLNKDRRRADRGLRIAAALITFVFAACNTALWIGWNGSYMTNILSGLSVWALAAVCVFAVLQTRALSKPAFIAFFAALILLIALQGTTFFVPENVVAALDTVCSVLIFTGQFLFAVKLVHGFCVRAPEKSLFALSCSWVCFSLYALYMSSGYVYLAVFAVLTVAVVFAFFALLRLTRKKEANV